MQFTFSDIKMPKMYTFSQHNTIGSRKGKAVDNKVHSRKCNGCGSPGNTIGWSLAATRTVELTTQWNVLKGLTEMLFAAPQVRQDRKMWKMDRINNYLEIFQKLGKEIFIKRPLKINKAQMHKQ